MSTDTTSTNGSAAATAPKPTTENYAEDLYRPTASTDKVRAAVESAMGRIVSEALHQAHQYVSLAEHYDHDTEPGVRYGHLVDATECIEIALTHLAMFKAAMNYRLIATHPVDDTDESEPVELRYWPVTG